MMHGADAWLHVVRRAIVAARKCLLFEPASASSSKFLQIAAPRLQANEARPEHAHSLHPQ